MLKKVIYPVISLVFFLTLWEVLGGHLIPPPSKVVPAFFEIKGRLWHHTLCTLSEMGVATCLALCLSFPMAWAMLRLSFVKALLEPFFLIVQCLPMFTLAPLFVLWFGWSFWAVVVPTTLMILFPLTMSLYRGIHSTPAPFIDFFHVHGATPLDEFLKLRIPYALPQLFAGLRITAAIAGMGAIAGEWAGAQSGLGVYLHMCHRNLDLEGVFAALFCLLLLSLSFYGTVLFLEKLLIKRSHYYALHQ